MHHLKRTCSTILLSTAVFFLTLGDFSSNLIGSERAAAQNALPSMRNGITSPFSTEGSARAGEQQALDFRARLNDASNLNTSTFTSPGSGSAGSYALTREALSAAIQQSGSTPASEPTTPSEQSGQETPPPPPTNQPQSDPAPATATVSGGSRVDVGNSSALARALGNARCGQSIIVGNGTYSGNFRVDANCRADNPLIIRAAAPQQAVIDSRMEIRGAHIHLRGFYFRGGNASMVVYGDRHKLIGNKFEGWAVNTALSLYSGRGTEVAYNEFTKPDPFRTGNLGNYPLRIGIRTSHSSSLIHTDAHIHHNYFHEFPAKPNPNKYHSGQSDAIEVCFTGSMVRSGWMIEHNLIDRHRQGHGVIDVKCANGTTVRFNTLINSPDGRLDLRNGNGGKMISNWIENAGGIGIQADSHEIVGNVLTGSGFPEIILGTGDVTSNGVHSDKQSANRNTLNCNQGVHNIGKYSMPHPARDNTVNAANGRVILGRQANTKVSPNANCNGVSQARRLSASEVGLQGLARSGL